MKSLKKALVALDLTSMDEVLLAYSKFMSALFQLEKVHFVHVIPDHVLLRNMNVGFKTVVPPDKTIEERVKNSLETEVEAHFDVDQGETAVEIDVLEGRIYNKLIRHTNEEKIDLLLVGKKRKTSNSGVNAFRVARNSTAAVCFVTEKASHKIQNILVPIDLSDYSLRALQTALHLQSRLENSKITCVYVVQLPPPMYGMTHDFEQSMDSIKENVRVSYHQFLETNGIKSSDLKFVVLNDGFMNIAQVIQEYAYLHHTDLIVMGAKGSSAIKNVIFGSVTERLVSYEDEIPVLVTR